MPAAVLFVDDDAVLRLVVSEQLEALGVKADVAPDGAAAVDCAKVHRYNLILLDILMPVMSGYDAARAIRAHELAMGWQPTPIIAITSDPHRSLCLEAGMNDCLQKPVLLEDLRKLLAKWLNSEGTSLSPPQPP